MWVLRVVAMTKQNNNQTNAHEQIHELINNETQQNFYPEDSFNRWQKHGHDRLYVRDGDGYIDLNNGTAQNLSVNGIDFNFGNKNGDTLVRNEDDNVIEVWTNNGVSESLWFEIPLEIINN